MTRLSHSRPSTRSFARTAALRRIAAVAMVFGVSGCAWTLGSTPEPLDPTLPVASVPSASQIGVDYVPPNVTPLRNRAVTTALSPQRALDVVSQTAQSLGMTVEQRVDGPDAAAVLRFTGTPRDFLDCGWLELQRGGGAVQRGSAAVGRAAFPLIDDQTGDRITGQRRMRLDARVTARTEIDSVGRTVVSVQTRYVVTKTIDAVRRNGTPIGVSVDSIGINTGGDGRFNSGTLCQTTGILEQAMLRGL